MKRSICLPIILASCAFACLTNSSSAEDKKVYNLATVVKISGINWFNYMETGVKKFGQDTGNKTVQLGPPTTDSAQQIQIVEDLIAKKVDAITVVPFQPRQLYLPGLPLRRPDQSRAHLWKRCLGIL